MSQTAASLCDDSPLWMRRCSFRWCLYLKAFPHSLHLNLRFPAPSFSSGGWGQKNRVHHVTEEEWEREAHHDSVEQRPRGNLIVFSEAEVTVHHFLRNTVGCSEVTAWRCIPIISDADTDKQTQTVASPRCWTEGFCLFSQVTDMKKNQQKAWFLVFKSPQVYLNWTHTPQRPGESSTSLMSWPRHFVGENRPSNLTGGKCRFWVLNSVLVFSSYILWPIRQTIM